MKGQKASHRVFVGMSGGVDSSVSAALLKERGFDVTGVFIKAWQPDWMECTWREDRLDAMRVCAKLGIPFETLDLEKEYKREVVDYMISEYKAGRTPNPDIMCNRHVKFGAFFDWAMARGADFVATGHYARIESVGEGATATHRLLAGRDGGKDQSYFLWTLTERELSKTMFPVGDIEKPQVRKLALKFGLPTAAKKDSQGLCFMGKVDVKEFLSHYIEAKRGDVLDEKGTVIGTHDGAVFLTLGERHGFEVAPAHADGKPFYVIARDIAKNAVTVSHDASLAMANAASGGSGESAAIRLESANWIIAPEAGKRYMARIRHLGELMPCAIELAGASGKAAVRFGSPVIAASGQSVVVYDGDACIGGGIVA
jgi:tRNA-specific 2-thiouridylase